MIYHPMRWSVLTGRHLRACQSCDHTDARPARRGREETGQDAHGRTLARAVGAEEPDDLPSGNVEGDPVHRQDRAKAFGDVLDLDHARLTQPCEGLDYSSWGLGARCWEQRQGDGELRTTGISGNLQHQIAHRSSDKNNSNRCDNLVTSHSSSRTVPSLRSSESALSFLPLSALAYNSQDGGPPKAAGATHGRPYRATGQALPA